MALAETAELSVLLKLQDQLSAPLKGVQSELKGMGAAVGSGSSGIVGGLGKAERAAGKFGSAMSHAKNEIGGLVSGPLGFIGVSAGLLSIGGLFEKSIGKATEWGLAIEKLTGLTGNSAESMSGLLAVTEKYGVSNERIAQIVGFTEKTLGLLSAATGKAAKATKSAALTHLEAEKLHIQAIGGSVKAIDKLISEQKASDALNAKATVGISKLTALQKEYGVVLTTTKGKALDFNSVFLHVADYYAGNAAASDKAALAAKVFGRGYADLIPILRLGSKGILEAESAAKDLGLTLTATNVGDLKQYRETMRELGDAVGGLQLQIGLALIPAVKGMATSLTQFVSSHRADIVNFFKDAAHFAGEVGDAISKYVVPGFQAIASAWDKVPDGVKQFLIGGFIANKASKMLFDVSLPDIAKGLLSRGGSPASALWVQQVGIGGGGGGIVGSAASLAQKVIIIGMAAEVADLIHGAISPGGGLEGRTQGKGGGLLPADQLAWPFGPKNTPHIDLGPIKNIFGGDSAFATGTGNTGGSISESLSGGAPTGTAAYARFMSQTALAAAGVHSFADGMAEAAAATKKAAADIRGANLAHALLSEIGGLKGVAARSAAKYGHGGLGSAAVQATYDRDVARRIDGVLHSGRTVEAKIAALTAIQKQLGRDGDKKTRDLLNSDLKDLKKVKPPAVTVNVATNVQVSANSVIAKYNQNRTYGPTDPQHKSNRNPIAS